MATLEELEKRIQVLEDVEAIRKLKARYGHLVDDRFDSSGRLKGKEDLESIANEITKLFTEDAVWDRGGEIGFLAGKEPATIKGRREIYEHFVQPVSYNFHAHYFLNAHITPEGDRARARWYLWMPATMSDNTPVWFSAINDEEYVRKNGQWFFSHVKSRMLFLTSYDKGWVKERFKI